jgi:lauroyl/myristoyl acyltransferase
VTVRSRLGELRRGPNGSPRHAAPFGRGPLAARALAAVIDGAAWAGSRVPAEVAHAGARAGGTVEWAARRRKRRLLARNLAHAVGLPPDHAEVRALVRREIVNEARRSADLLWALGRPDELRATTTFSGLGHVADALARGRGLLLAGIHVGGWEVATAIPQAVVPVPTTALVADDWLAWAMEHMRVTRGLRVLYRTAPALQAARILRDGEALLVLGDDGWGDMPRGHRVRFLDAEAMLPGGIVSLSRLCQTPIVGFTVLPIAPRRWHVTIDPAVDPPERRAREAGEQRVLQQLADRWSEIIRGSPEHWAAAYPIRWVDGA